MPAEIFRKYEFDSEQQAKDLIAQVNPECINTVVHLGELTEGKWSVDVLWCNCEMCPEILWDYIFIGEESSHEFLGYDNRGYLPEEMNFSNSNFSK